MGFPCTNLLKILNCFLLLTIINAQETCVTPAFENGYCVPYKECPYVNELSKNYGSIMKIPQYYLDYIQKSRCSENNQPVRLCCTISNYNPKPVTQEPSPPPPVVTPVTTDSRYTADLDNSRNYESQLNVQGFNILNELSCGQPDGDRVAGGNETELGEYPWMAILQYDTPDEQFKCGGSLITDRFVLTATHCVNQPVYPVISVRLGEHDLTTNPDCRQRRKYICNPPKEDIEVDDIILHPEYSERYRINDIALIKLKRSVQFRKNIKPVCLPITQASLALNTDVLHIAGWGTTEKGVKSDVLLKAEVSRKDNSVCQRIFSTIIINQKHICAGDLDTGRDTCPGDSGGPLIGFNSYKNVKRYIQYGIVASGGRACNLSQGLPGLYTNIITYMPWITSNIV